MIPIKFLIIFRELSITQCLRSHRHRQHLWHILMLHPSTLNAALSREPKHRATPRKEIRCKAGGGGGQAHQEKTGRLGDLGRLSLWHEKEPGGVEVRGESSASAEITFLQSLELKQEYRGGGERRRCIPRTNHCTANSGVELRARWNKFGLSTQRRI